MARALSNRMVEQQGGGTTNREAKFDEPAHETELARHAQLGPFRKANLAIDLSAVALTAGGVDADAPASVIASRAGTIVGVAYQFAANITAGGASAASIQPAVGPAGAALVAAGSVAAVASGGSAAQSGSVDQAAPIPFNEGDLLGVLLSTSHTFAPTTDDVAVYLVVRWAA